MEMGGEAGETSPPIKPSDEGGLIPPEGNCGGELLTRPRERSRRRGATDADDTFRPMKRPSAISPSPAAVRRTWKNRRCEA
jgi:hypothetical protein